MSLDATDEYCRLSQSTTIEAMKRYVKAIRAVPEGTYMQQPTHNDLVHQMDINAKWGFPGMFVHRLYVLGVDKLSCCLG